MSHSPISADPFAFTLPPPLARPLPVVSDDVAPSRPRPLVVPSSMLAVEYSAPYLDRERLALTEPLKLRSSSLVWLDSPRSITRPSSSASASSKTSTSSITSTSTASISTQRRFSPYSPSVAHAPILREDAGTSITEWRAGMTRPKLAPLPGLGLNPTRSSLTTEHKRVLFASLLFACSERGGRDPTMRSRESEAFATRFGVKATQIRTWLGSVRRNHLMWSHETRTLNLASAQKYAAKLGVPWPSNLIFPTATAAAVDDSADASKSTMTMQDKLELYERCGLPFRGTGFKKQD